RLLAVEDLRHDGEVTQSGIGRGADHHLGDFLVTDLCHRHHVAGGGGFGDQRLQLGEVDVFGDVVGGALVGSQGGELFGAPHGLHVGAGDIVGGEDGRGGAEFGPHVRNDVPIHGGQVRQSWTVVLDDPVHPALDVVAPQHLQHHILGRDPVRERAGQL